MEGMRELIKATLGRTLESCAEEDRLAAAWAVACGRAMSEHGSLAGYANGVVRVHVRDGVWLKQMMSMRGQLAAELARISEIRVDEIHFEMMRNGK
jgi:Dna[CI] antecedent, DciA